MARILADTAKFAVQFDVKSGGDCVSVNCSSGFFLKFAKPIFCDSDVGFKFSHPGYTFTLSEVKRHVDQKTSEQSRKLVLKFMCQGMPQQLVLHVYNTRHSIMVQSGARMPDCTPAATWATGGPARR